MRSTTIAAVVAMAAALMLAAACQLDGGSAGEPTRINTAGVSAGNAALFGIAQGAQQRTTLATVMDGQGEIHVTGQGKVSIEPDLAILNLGVETRGTTVSEAREAAATAMSAVMESLTSEGVEEKDIQTSRFDINDEREWQEITENGVRTSKSVLVGYRVRNNLTVKVRDLDNVSAVIDGAAEAGGDAIRFNGLNFTAEDLSTVMEQLREDAVNDAKSKAQHFADLAEVGLGELVFISDGTVARPLFRESFAFAAAAPAAQAFDTGISRGELEVNMSVQTVFTIE
ncbi:MAG: SIMPL domain-containing protein [Dehalococcoidia bacterium]|nr:SIMPL domain-containing protein [Dehalococcoidia bacterium]